MHGQVRVKHVPEKWELVVRVDKILWVEPRGWYPPSCYPDPDHTNLYLMGNQRAVLGINSLGFNTIEVHNS